MKKISDVIDLEVAKLPIFQELMKQTAEEDVRMGQAVVNTLMKDLGESPEAVRGAVLSLNVVMAIAGMCQEMDRVEHLPGGLEIVAVCIGIHPATIAAAKVLEGQPQ